MNSRDYLAGSPDYVRDFTFYLETILGRSDKTIYEYYLDVRTFLRFLKFTNNMVPEDTEYTEIEVGDVTIEMLKEVTLDDVYNYMHFISSERQNASNTRARKGSSLRVFYKYLATKSKYRIENPIASLEIPSGKKTLPKHLSLEESIDILKVIEGDNKARDYCILTLFLNCGLRLAELVGINVSDIRKDSLRVLGKGSKERMIYLNEACLSAIRDYMSVRPVSNKQKEAFFISRNGKRISRRRVQQIVEHNLELIGLDGMGYSTHKLRHTAATLLFQYGDVDIRVLKDILGHESINTTEIYTHVSNKQMQEAASKSPLSQVSKEKDAAQY
ncbi:MAG: tyrosine-type recombinase/integrase [Oscillospiraceae bacterium]|jgi:site-specific recombinase XerD|nr:tyrosine-type recombinase/integrase [Oscillospiraceae bacterium]